MRSLSWLAAAAATSAGGCAGDGPARPSRVETTAVPCVEDVDTGMKRPDGKPDVFTIQGPGACAAALGAFLDQHPGLRIGEIVSVQYVREPQPYLEQGTQELVVVHADDGPWPRASDLRVDGPAAPCIDPERSSATPAEYSARFCDKSIAFSYSIQDHVFVVPIVSERIVSEQVETWSYLQVVRRGE